MDVNRGIYPDPARDTKDCKRRGSNYLP